MSNYLIRPMARDEVQLAVNWAAAEGWNPGLHDATSYYAADRNGFLVGVLDGEPVATISVVRYGEGFGFLGFYIVAPPYRGRGYGMRIWQAGLAYLAGRNVGLDGVVDQQDNYRKSGFQLAYRNVRYEGVGGGTPPDCADLVDLQDVPVEVVLAYDRSFFPDDRVVFLKNWIRQPEAQALGMLRDGDLVGYGVIRPCRTGWKIGPLFADDARTAETMFLALKANGTADAPVFLDVPEVNTQAVALAERHGMFVMFETARMYNREIPELPLELTYGVTSFELG